MMHLCQRNIDMESDTSFEWFAPAGLKSSCGLPTELEPLVHRAAFFWTTSHMQLAFYGACKNYEDRGDLQTLLTLLQTRNKQVLAYIVQCVQHGNYADLRAYLASSSDSVELELSLLAGEVSQMAYARQVLTVAYEDAYFSLCCLASALQVAVLCFESGWEAKYALPLFCEVECSAIVAVLPLQQYSLYLALSPQYVFIPRCLQNIVTGYASLLGLTNIQELSPEISKVIRIQTDRCKANAVCMALVTSRLLKVAKDAIVGMQFEITFCKMHNQPGTRMPCGHWVCAQCVFPSGDPGQWTAHAACQCPMCTTYLTFADIRKLVRDDLFCARMQGALVCGTCSNSFAAAKILTLQCGHTVCISCALQAVYSKKRVCWVCEAPTKKDFLRFLKPVGCDCCGQWVSPESLPPVVCNGLIACAHCYDSLEVCPHPSHNRHFLPELDQQRLRRFFFQCTQCQRVLNRKNLFIWCSCLCLACQDCVYMRMAAVRNPSKCPFCESPVAAEHQEAIKGIVGERAQAEEADPLELGPEEVAPMEVGPAEEGNKEEAKEPGEKANKAAEAPPAVPKDPAPVPKPA